MRLIDADRFKNWIMDRYICFDHTLEDIDAQPTVDAVQVLPSAEPEPLTINFAQELDRETIEKVKESMKNAPVLIMAVNDDSAESERKKGRWITKSTNGEMSDVCSVCGYVEWDEPHNYCPNCGAEMRGEEDESMD